MTRRRWIDTVILVVFGAGLHAVGARTAMAGAPPPSVRVRLQAAGYAVHDDGRVQVMLELASPATVAAYATASRVSALGLGGASATAAAAARAALAVVEGEQQSVIAELGRRNPEAQVLFRVGRVYNGVAIEVGADYVDALATLPGVVAVHPLIPKRLTNSTSVPFIGAPTIWSGFAQTGAGVRVGVIDTGIDYDHADFGGRGAYQSSYTSAGWPKGTKVAGGYDFAGDNYDADSTSSAKRTPHPDPDPMDCNGHGTHVAGTVAGYGVAIDGSTYNGPYGPETAFSNLRIGPGVAPGAVLYALRIFGCSGSSGLVTQALDWAVDPNGDGDPSDHLDVVNLSLGSPYGTPDDPDAAACNRAAQAGVIVVVAAGNDGDGYFVVSAPGVADRAISVAAVGDPGATSYQLAVNAPADLEGIVDALPAAFGPLIPDAGLTGDLAVGAPQDGCGAFTNGAAVNGKIAMVARGTCTFVTKVKNAQNAGAVAVIVVNNVAGYVTMAGSDPTITIPSALISLSDGNVIGSRLPTPGVNVTIGKVSMADAVASFSSRGPRLGDAALKPELAAPGISIVSAAAGTGSDGATLSGTSMATPHVAGSMALLRGLHPTWTVEELKALALDTATQPVYSGANSALPVVGAGRSGAGRIDLTRAGTSEAVAFADGAGGLGSLSFGVVDVADHATIRKDLRIVNHGNEIAVFTVGFVATLPCRGVSVDFPGGASVTVPASSSVTVPVGLEVDGTALQHPRDPSAVAGAGTVAREWLGEFAGFVVLTPETGTELRVPLYAAPRPVAAMTTLEPALGLAGSDGVAKLHLAGRGVHTGDAFPNDIVSLVSAFELQETTSGAGAGQPGWLGVASDWAAQVALGKGVPDTTIYFGLALGGDFLTPEGGISLDVMIDTNGDGRDDYDVSLADAGTATDVFLSQLCRVNGSCTTGLPLGGVAPDVRDLGLFGNNILVLPVRASDLGLSGGNSRFRYSVKRGTSRAWHSFDPANPGLAFEGTGYLGGTAVQPLFVDQPGNELGVRYDRTMYQADAALGVLLLHHHNASGARVQVIPVELGDCALQLDASVPAAAAAGTPAAFTAAITSQGCSGGVTVDWDFGDGTAHGVAAGASHVYANPGTYEWVVVVSSGAFSTTARGTIVVTEASGRTVRRVVGRSSS